MTADGDGAHPKASVGKPAAVFVMESASVGNLSQVTVVAPPSSVSVRTISDGLDEDRVQQSDHDRIGPESSATIHELNTEAPPMTSDTGWSAFLRSPHFTVISTGVVVLAAGLGMYVLLDGKISSLRLETKSDLQLAAQRSDNQFAKVDSRFDKIDSKFDAVLSKIDSDSKELRLLLQGSRP